MQRKDLLTRVDILISKLNDVLGTVIHTQYEHKCDYGSFVEARAAAISFVSQVYGEAHPHFRTFEDISKHSTEASVKGQIGVLKAIKDELEGGWLFDLKKLVAAEIFADFIEMADHLLDTGYKDAAAVMIGSVLEESLRQACASSGVPVSIEKDGRMVPVKADKLNADLAKAGVYSGLRQKSVTAWLAIRNKAAHGEYTEYTAEEVRTMIAGVTEFSAILSDT